MIALRSRIVALAWVAMLAVAAGCGTTRWSDSARTATEQLLISDAVDQAIAQLDFSALAGHDVYFDPQYLEGCVDENYVTSTLRQHLLASGCVLKENRDDATYVVEARSGAVGTDRNDVMLGVPSVNVPGFVPGAMALPSSIPEIPLAKNTHQRGVAKIAVFAFNRTTGKPVWQSGVAPVTSYMKDSWVLGAGPFRKGSADPKTKFAGDVLSLGPGQEAVVAAVPRKQVPLTSEAFFPEGVAPAESSSSEAVAAAAPPPAAPAAAPVAASAVVPAVAAAVLPPVASPAPAVSAAVTTPLSPAALPSPSVARPRSDPAAAMNGPHSAAPRDSLGHVERTPRGQLASHGSD